MVRNQRDDTQTEFTVTNHTAGLSLNCNAEAGAALTADTLGSLIKVLIENGVISGTVA